MARTAPDAVLDGLAGQVADLPGEAGVRWFTSASDKAALGSLILVATEAFIAGWSTRHPVVAFTVLAYGISRTTTLIPTLMGSVITVAGLAATPGLARWVRPP